MQTDEVRHIDAQDRTELTSSTIINEERLRDQRVLHQCSIISGLVSSIISVHGQDNASSRLLTTGLAMVIKVKNNYESECGDNNFAFSTRLISTTST